jgi:hypothetical protein
MIKHTHLRAAMTPMYHLFQSSIKRSCLLLFLISLLCYPAVADIYLSTMQKNGLPVPHPTNTFHCTDKIFGVVVDQWPADSNHLMEAYWTDPQGKQREHTRYNFTARKGKTHTWAWLLLHPAEPDMLDRLLMQENDSLLEFNGEWHVDFYIDGESIGKLTFQLICG